jgi:hypothetical protein
MYTVRAMARVVYLVAASIGGAMVMVGSGGLVMAKKRIGRPPLGRDDINVKIDRVLAGRAKVIAQGRGVSLAQYLSEVTKAVINRDYAQLMRELEGGSK